MIPLYLLTFIIYCLYAILPFFKLTPYLHYMAGAVFAVSGSILWVTISRSVSKSEVAIYGLYFDAVITISFMLTPLLFTGFNLNFKQVIGIVLILAGLVISKL